jgi:hypothetical protein
MCNATAQHVLAFGIANDEGNGTPDRDFLVMIS